MSALAAAGVSVAASRAFIFNSEQTANAMTVIDANDDGNTWQFYGDCMLYGVSDAGLDADDWLITPGTVLSADSVYEVAVSAHADDSWAERFSVSVGTAPTVEAMTQTVVPDTTATNSQYASFTGRFIPAADGQWHVGVHVTTPVNDGSYFYVESISVRAVAAAKAPAAVANAAIALSDKGQTATVSFTVPTTDNAGQPIDAVDSVVVKRNGNPGATFKVAGVKAGEQGSVADRPGINGNVSYTITPYNAHGAGVSATVTAWAGTDTPAAVTGARITAADDNGNITLSWTAPTHGVHGGYVNPDSITYTVAGINGSQRSTTTVSATTLTDRINVTDGQQRLAWYVITPRNAAGAGTATSTDTAFVGKPYALPYAESFPRRQPARGPWSINNDEVAEWYVMQYGTYADPADGDGGLLSFATVTEGRRATICGPKVSLSGSANPTLKMRVYDMGRGPHHLRVMLRKPDGSYSLLDDFSPIDTTLTGNFGQWVQKTYSLDGFQSLDHVQLVLQGVGGHTDQPATIVPLYVDDITITDPLTDDLAAGKLSANNDHVEAGDDVSFSFTISNKGSRPATGYSAILLRDGKPCGAAASAQLETIPVGDSVRVSLTDAPNGDASETSRYTARVQWDADLDSTNNTSAEALVTVLPGKPYPTAVSASCGTDGTVTVNWTAPTVDATEAETVTESFETYAPFTISHFGQWTLFDGDRQSTIGIQDGQGNFVQYPNVERPMAFQVFNPIAAGVASSGFTAHSGAQVAAAFSAGRYTANDDWLISPAVDGAQTIIFYACSPAASYYGTAERIQVLCSTTGTDTADFKPVGQVITVPGRWTQYTATLPEGATHFAIRCTSQDQYILFIDDITYRRAASDITLTGFNIYSNSTLIATAGPSATSWSGTDSNADTGEGTPCPYSVAATYNTGESRHAAAVWADTPSRIAGVEGSTPKAQGTQLYDISGRRLRAVSPTGVTIIRTGNQSRKVIAK